jgi:predicted DNA-binding transcriptional regulator YafY
MHHPDPQVRSISPHAIVFDGVRWHLRGFCYSHQDFRDFVLSRIAEVAQEVDQGVDPAADQCWHSRVSVIVAPAPHLSESQQNAIAIDYGMLDGSIQLVTREALLLYLLQQLPLYSPVGRSRHNQIVLKNREELQPILDRLGIDVD